MCGVGGAAVGRRGSESIASDRQSSSAFISICIRDPIKIPLREKEHSVT